MTIYKTHITMDHAVHTDIWSDREAAESYIENVAYNPRYIDGYMLILQDTGEIFKDIDFIEYPKQYKDIEPIPIDNTPVFA